MLRWPSAGRKSIWPRAPQPPGCWDSEGAAEESTQTFAVMLRSAVGARPLSPHTYSTESSVDVPGACQLQTYFITCPYDIAVNHVGRLPCRFAYTWV